MNPLQITPTSIDLANVLSYLHQRPGAADPIDDAIGIEALSFLEAENRAQQGQGFSRPILAEDLIHLAGQVMGPVPDRALRTTALMTASASRLRGCSMGGGTILDRALKMLERVSDHYVGDTAIGIVTFASPAHGFTR